jgi:hypothetical protein
MVMREDFEEGFVGEVAIDRPILGLVFWSLAKSNA